MKRRRHLRLPAQQRGFLGENNADGVTDPVFQAGALVELRNYHLIGRGRLKKRQGWTPYVTAKPNSTNTIQSLLHYQFGNTSHLIAHCAGGLYKLDGTSWSAITGSLSLSGSDNRHMRSTTFHDNTNSYIIATDNNGPPWYWTGTGNVVALPTITSASDFATFKEHVFAINVPGLQTAVRYSDAGLVATWPSEHNFHCSRESHGVALASHSSETLLALHRRSIHAINFNYGASGALASFFTTNLVDGSTGCAARGSVVTREGRPYWADDAGIYMIGDPRRPAKYISRPIETFWNKLNKSRISEMVGFSRGEPWSEVCWLVSTSTSSTHNAAIVYNPAVASLYGDEHAWVIFESLAGKLNFSAAINFEDSNKINHTLVGTYDGVVGKAWGSDESTTQNTDGYVDADSAGTAVRTSLITGFLDLGYEGMKGLRETWLDLDLATNKTFSLSVAGLEEELVTTSETTVSTTGALLGSFMLDEDYLVSAATAQEQFQTEGSSRYFQFTLTEEDTGTPHGVNGIHFLYSPRGMRIR